jgi:hypothetical protein
VTHVSFPFRRQEPLARLPRKLCTCFLLYFALSLQEKTGVKKPSRQQTSEYTTKVQIGR